MNHGVLGIDVGARKGCDAVLLSEKRYALQQWSGVTPAELELLIQSVKPMAVAIDGPPHWCRGERSRLAERWLREQRFRCFFTPSKTRGETQPFFAWMKVSFEIFRRLKSHYPLFQGAAVVGHALEVFPHATAIRLLGGIQNVVVDKKVVRRAALARADVETSKLNTIDQLDAALAAVTAWLALEGKAEWGGDRCNGYIVIPR